MPPWEGVTWEPWEEISLDTAVIQASRPHGLYDLAESTILELSLSVWNIEHLEIGTRPVGESR